MSDYSAEFAILEQLGREDAFPSDYTVLDTETNGFSHNYNVIVDMSWAIVRNNKIVQSDSLLLNWALFPHIDHQQIQQHLLRLEEEYRKDGRPFYYQWERLCREGIHPVEATEVYAKIIDTTISRGEHLLGHGLWNFDTRMINAATRRCLNGYELPWRENSIIDTGLTEKAIQIGSAPWPTESLHTWYKRVCYTRAKGVQYSLIPHCVPKYHLDKRYGLDMKLAHMGQFDCTLIHCLQNTYKQLVEILNGSRTSLDANI